MEKLWHIYPHDAAEIDSLARRAGVSPLVAQLLILRGVTRHDSVARFLDPKLTFLNEPERLPGCIQAVEILHKAIQCGRRIVVYGDYDVDGMTGCAILHRGLSLLGATVEHYLPSRVEEGYGLHETSIRRLAKERNADIIITVDCGITSVREAQVAKECGVTLIITDHHEPNAVLPEAAAVVHPRVPVGVYPFADLSGAGVAWKLALALCQRVAGQKKVSPRMRDFLLQAIGLASLGTICDMVPLVDENRVLVKSGLHSLFNCPPVGLAKLMQITELDRKTSLESEDVAFILGPRINAAGRLGQAPLALELLLTEKPGRASELAAYIHNLNESRQTLERSMNRAANAMIRERFDPDNDPVFVLAEYGWNPGVVGLVAGRIAERYHRPVVMISLDETGIKPGSGSARSIPRFDIRAALEACQEHLLGFGGHKAAAGLRIRPEKVDALRDALRQYAFEHLTDEQARGRIDIEAEAPFSVLTYQTVRQLERLAPFGQGNKRPLVYTSGVTVDGPLKTMGSGDAHLSLSLRQHNQRFRAVAFRRAEWHEPLENCDSPIDVAFHPVINTWQGRSSVQLQLVDWRVSTRAG